MTEMYRHVLILCQLESIRRYAQGTGLDDLAHGGAAYYAFHVLTRYGLYEDVRKELGIK